MYVYTYVYVYAYTYVYVYAYAYLHGYVYVYLFSVMFVCRLVISVQGVITIDLSSLGCIVPEILKA